MRRITKTTAPPGDTNDVAGTLVPSKVVAVSAMNAAVAALMAIFLCMSPLSRKTGFRQNLLEDKTLFVLPRLTLVQNLSFPGLTVSSTGLDCRSTTAVP